MYVKQLNEIIKPESYMIIVIDINIVFYFNNKKTFKLM